MLSTDEVWGCHWTMKNLGLVIAISAALVAASLGIRAPFAPVDTERPPGADTDVTGSIPIPVIPDPSRLPIVLDQHKTPSATSREPPTQSNRGRILFPLTVVAVLSLIVIGALADNMRLRAAASDKTVLPEKDTEVFKEQRTVRLANGCGCCIACSPAAQERSQLAQVGRPRK